MSVFYLLALYSIFLAIFFVGQTLGGVKRAGVCASDHHALSGGSRSYLRGQGPNINISLNTFARILIYFTNPTSVYILYARSGAFAIRLLLTSYALAALALFSCGTSARRSAAIVISTTWGLAIGGAIYAYSALACLARGASARRSAAIVISTTWDITNGSAAINCGSRQTCRKTSVKAISSILYAIGVIRTNPPTRIGLATEVSAKLRDGVSTCAIIPQNTCWIRFFRKVSVVAISDRFRPIRRITCESLQAVCVLRRQEHISAPYLY